MAAALLTPKARRDREIVVKPALRLFSLHLQPFLPPFCASLLLVHRQTELCLLELHDIRTQWKSSEFLG